MTANNDETFGSLPMRKRELIHISNNQYRITDSHGAEKNVEANTAYEAFKLAGVKNAIKIVRLATIKPIIVKKAAFVPTMPDEAPDPVMSEVEEFMNLRKLLRPVMSADDLDKLMHNIGVVHEPVIEQPANDSTAQSLEPAQTSVSVPKAEPVAQNTAPIQPSGNIEGTDVHNEGFDEIIPASASQQAAKPKAAAKELPKRIEIPELSVQEAPISPEKSLSPEEVDKLLNNK